MSLAALIFGEVGKKLDGWGRICVGRWAMGSPMSAAAVLEREFLPLRAKLIEIGAMLDRMERSEGSVTDDPRRQKVEKALAILRSSDGDRAERLQMLFSLAYDEHWRENLGVTPVT
jgi:hypothetical protein